MASYNCFETQLHTTITGLASFMMLRAGHVGSELFILAAGFSLDFFSATTIIEPATQITLVATLVPALKTPHTTPAVSHVYIEIQRDISFDLERIVSRFPSLQLKCCRDGM